MSQGTVTSFLLAWQAGNADALERATKLIYDELCRLAAVFLLRERPGHTLQPSELVAEAYVRLVGTETPRLESRSHFVGIAARAMRQVLIDHARRRKTDKRGGGGLTVMLDEDRVGGRAEPVDFLAIHESLRELEKVDPRRAKVVEYVYFGGLDLDEIAKLLDVHRNTVMGDLRIARAWLKSRL